ncbi:MAG: hypothetical protein M3336_01555 [Chloroflexota bacterium]|nr:hypothetical protein [Chloroflexota bacterium]
MNSTVFGKHRRPGSIAATLIAIAGAGCAVAGALSLWAAINDPPQPGDPPLSWYLVLAIGGIAFAIRAIADRARIAWALLALLGSILSLLTFWTFGLLYAG